MWDNIKATAAAASIFEHNITSEHSSKTYANLNQTTWRHRRQ
jgi:hypothetical protein